MSVSALTSISRECKICAGELKDGDKIAVVLITDAFEPDAKTRADEQLPQDQLCADMDWNEQDEMHVRCYYRVMDAWFTAE